MKRILKNSIFFHPTNNKDAKNLPDGTLHCNLVFSTIFFELFCFFYKKIIIIP